MEQQHSMTSLEQGTATAREIGSAFKVAEVNPFLRGYLTFGEAVVFLYSEDPAVVIEYATEFKLSGLDHRAFLLVVEPLRRGFQSPGAAEDALINQDLLPGKTKASARHKGGHLREIDRSEWADVKIAYHADDSFSKGLRIEPSDVMSDEYFDDIRIPLDQFLEASPQLERALAEFLPEIPHGRLQHHSADYGDKAVQIESKLSGGERSFDQLSEHDDCKTGKPDKKTGRKRGMVPYDDSKHLAAMAKLLNDKDARSANNAAIIVVGRDEVQGVAIEDSKITRLRKSFLKSYEQVNGIWRVKKRE